MLRKCLTSVAVMAAVFAGTAGVANASTPAPATFKTSACIPGAPVAGCTPGDHRGDHRGGRGGFLGGRGGLLGGFGLGGFLGGNRTIINNEYANTFWQRDGVILPYAQAASSCGCSGAPVGWTQVVDPAAVEVVPFYGAPVTGDGSCVSLTSVNWGLPGWNRGVRLYHRR
jgi:hypothetical protein